MEISGLSAEAPVTLSDNEFKERLAAAIPHICAPSVEACAGTGIRPTTSFRRRC